MPKRHPIEPWPPGLTLQVIAAIDTAPTRQHRRAAVAYADTMAMAIERHVIGSRLPPQVRRARWAHIVTLLKLDGEQLPRAWQLDGRLGARPLVAEIRRQLDARGEAAPCQSPSPIVMPRAASPTQAAVSALPAHSVASI